MIDFVYLYNVVDLDYAYIAEASVDWADAVNIVSENRSEIEIYQRIHFMLHRYQGLKQYTTDSKYYRYEK